MYNWLKKFIRFATVDIWRVSLDQFSSKKAFFIRQLRILMLALRGFSEDKVQLRATALTLYTLLAIVPVLAVAFAVSQGFGLENYLERELATVFAGREEVLEWMLSFSRSLLEATRGGVMAGVGMVILFWSIMKALGHIENSFNEIWQIRQQRSFTRRFADYFSLVFTAPILLVLSGGAIVFLETRIEYVSQNLEVLGFLSPVLMFVVRLIPYLLIWTLLTLLYMIMPNTRVKFSSALIAGIIAGTLLVLVQWAYVYFQVGVSRYSAIYGSFAALPLLIIWMQVSWLVVLFGAEISFANQNLEHYEFETESLNMNEYNRRLIIMNIVHLLVKNFENSAPPYTAKQVADDLKMPVRLARDLLYELSQAGIISPIKMKEDKETAYQPAVDINKITPKYIIDSLEGHGMNVLMVKDSREVEELDKVLKSFNKALEKCPENKLLKDI